MTIISYFGFNYFFEQDLIVLDANVRVGENIGFNTDPDALRFGTIVPGGASKRFINVTHSNDFPMSVSITAEGDIAEYLSTSDNNFVVGPEEDRKVSIYVSTPGYIQKGNYSGRVYIQFKRAW